MVKKIFLLSIVLIVLICLTGCEEENNNAYWNDDGYYCKWEKDNKIAIGNISFISSNNVLFIPNEIDGRVVSKLGFKLFDGDGFFINFKDDDSLVKRYYAPSTIEVINNRYMQYCHNLKFFYCGNSEVDLSCLCLDFDSEIYVPFDSFEKLCGNSKDCLATIKKANVCYMLDENTYYYVDFYETGLKISFIPPIPKKLGYEFAGWFKEKELLNEWDFSIDTIRNLESEMKLYAKWIKND